MTLLLRPLSGSAFQIITLAVHLTSILYGTGTNTDRTPLVSPNLHIKLYREGKQMPSLAEQKKPFLIKVQLNWRWCSLRTTFSKTTVNKSPEGTVHWHQCISILRLLSFLPNNSELLPPTPPQAPSSKASFCSFEQHEKSWRCTCFRGYAKMSCFDYCNSAIYPHRC